MRGCTYLAGAVRYPEGAVWTRTGRRLSIRIHSVSWMSFLYNKRWCFWGRDKTTVDFFAFLLPCIHACMHVSLRLKSETVWKFDLHIIKGHFAAPAQIQLCTKFICISLQECSHLQFALMTQMFLCDRLFYLHPCYVVFNCLHILLMFKAKWWSRLWDYLASFVFLMQVYSNSFERKPFVKAFYSSSCALFSLLLRHYSSRILKRLWKQTFGSM